MSSLISDAEKASWSAEFADLHDTFGRDVVIYKQPDRVDVVTNNDFIYAYRGSQQGSNFQFDTVPVSGTFKMRIKWINASKEEDFPTDLHLPGQICRLKMTPEAYNFLSGFQSFYVDGVSCETVGSPQRHGLFDVDFYTLYAKIRTMS